jgi:hypothetical protein
MSGTIIQAPKQAPAGMGANTATAGAGTTPIQFIVTVGGQQIPVYGFNAVGGSYGSIGHAGISTDISSLLAAGIDIYEISAAKPSLLEVAISVKGGPYGLSPILMFAGEFVSSDWDFDTDALQIQARDWAGLLVDQKRVPTTIQDLNNALLTPGQAADTFGVDVENQTIAELVEQIADLFGFTPVLNLQGSNPQTGVQFGSDDVTWAPTSQDLWSMLNMLASDTGNVVYTTPSKQLVFGVPGAGLSTVTMSYGSNPLSTSSSFAPGNTSSGAVPTKDLHVKHNPRRNSTFSVLVLAHDGAASQITRGTTTVVGPDVAGFSTGIFDGPAALSARANLVGAQISVPLYTFRYEGLTQSQAQTKAHNIALDISRRNAVASWYVDGYPYLTPTQPIKFTSNSAFEPGFTKMAWNLTAISHTFKMPKGASGGIGTSSGGFYSSLNAWNLSVESLSGGTGAGEVD